MYLSDSEYCWHCWHGRPRKPVTFHQWIPEFLPLALEVDRRMSIWPVFFSLLPKNLTGFPPKTDVIILFLVFFGARLPQGGSSCLEKNHGLQQPWLPLCRFECDGLWSSSGGLLDMKSYVARNSCKVLVGILQCLTTSRSLLCIGVKWFWGFLTCSVHSALLWLRLGFLCRLRWRKNTSLTRLWQKRSLRITHGTPIGRDSSQTKC